MLLTVLKAVGVADLLDIALVAVLVYALLAWFKRAKAAFVAKGILVVTGVYMLSRATGMVMTTSIFHGFFAILLVALVVIFQEELRRTFEQIAVWSLSGGKFSDARPDNAGMLVRTIAEFARDRTGALIVLQGRDPLDRHLEGGWPLGGILSEALLKSIFDQHSIGHDGALIVEGSTVDRFGCRLPLTKEFHDTAQFGTRHAAALGLAELTDVLCLVVSEERGTVSVAQDGSLETVKGLGDLRERILRFYADKAPQPPRETLKAFLRKNTREKAIAASASVLLWGLFVLGAKPWRQTFELPARIQNAPGEFSVERTQPETLRVTFSGAMRDFLWLDRDRLAVRLDLSRGAPGVNRIPVTEGDISRPAGFFLEEIDPTIVEVSLGRKAAGGQVRLWR